MMMVAACINSCLAQCTWRKMQWCIEGPGESGKWGIEVEGLEVQVTGAGISMSLAAVGNVALIFKICWWSIIDKDTKAG